MFLMMMTTSRIIVFWLVLFILKETNLHWILLTKKRKSPFSVYFQLTILILDTDVLTDKSIAINKGDIKVDQPSFVQSFGTALIF